MQVVMKGVNFYRKLPDDVKSQIGTAVKCFGRKMFKTATTSLLNKSAESSSSRPSDTPLSQRVIKIVKTAAKLLPGVLTCAVTALTSVYAPWAAPLVSAVAYSAFNAAFGYVAKRCDRYDDDHTAKSDLKPKPESRPAVATSRRPEPTLINKELERGEQGKESTKKRAITVNQPVVSYNSACTYSTVCSRSAPVLSPLPYLNLYPLGFVIPVITATHWTPITTLVPVHVL